MILFTLVMVVVVAQSCLTLCGPWTVARQAPLSLKFPGKNTRVGSHPLLWRVFPTEELNPGHLHRRQIL